MAKTSEAIAKRDKNHKTKSPFEELSLKKFNFNTYKSNSTDAHSRFIKTQFHT